MSFKDFHSFHNCPLRSSSLLIVSKEKQTIVTATDEVFDILGYEPKDIVGKSINLLNPRQYYDAEKKKDKFTLCHESFGQLPFEICIHHDPLTNATDLDYWLIRPVSIICKKPSSPFTILRLSQFGTIEHAYPSNQFPQQSDQLKGLPIMSFIHESDVQSLCEKLCHIKHTAHYTFRVRWLHLLHPRESHNNDQDFEWVSFTVMNSPRRLSCDSANDPQSRPICIIRPDHELQIETENNYSSLFSAPCLLNELVSGTVRLLWERTRLGANTFFEMMECMHHALDQGKIYLIEYFAHILTQTLKTMHDLLYFSNESNIKDEQEMVYMKKHQFKIDNNHYLYEVSSVKVSVGNNIWSVPLYMKASNYLTDKKSCNRKQTTKNN